MAKNKPQYKIGEEIYTRAIAKMPRGIIREIYFNKKGFCYVVETPIKEHDSLFQVLLEDDIYKKHK